MQIPLPIIVTIVIVILIVIWRSSEGKRKTENVLGRKPKEKVTPEIPVPQETWNTSSSSPTPPPTKKKGVEFKFGTLVGWAAFVAVIYLFTSCANSVVKEMAKPRPATRTSISNNSISGTPQGDYLALPGIPDDPNGWTVINCPLGQTTTYKILHDTARVWVKSDNDPPILDWSEKYTKLGNGHELRFKSATNFPIVIRVGVK
ncbi:MAG: hypothetical protein WCT19_00970 [Candidatus Paceibacterota bacterium]|jgi:hypothetical protein